MNFILFRNVISKFWNEEMNGEVIRMLIRAGMILANIRIWKDFILARDSGLIPIGKVIAKSNSSEPIPEYYGDNISSGFKKQVRRQSSEQSNVFRNNQIT